TNWMNTPAIGDSSWRRDDQGTTANWRPNSGGDYYPVSSVGAHSARFHATDVFAGGTGNLDLYLNFSAASDKLISFDYLNSSYSSLDNLTVLISTDSGYSWTQLAQYYEQDNWTQEKIATSAT